MAVAPPLIASSLIRGICAMGRPQSSRRRAGGDVWLARPLRDRAAYSDVTDWRLS
jgi:hypothetical protein